MNLDDTRPIPGKPRKTPAAKQRARPRRRARLPMPDPMAVRTMRLRCRRSSASRSRRCLAYTSLRSRSAHRNEAAPQAGCCRQGPMLPHARIVQRGPAHTGFTVMRWIELEERHVACACENSLARRRLRMLARSSNENRKRRMLRQRLLSMRRGSIRISRRRKFGGWRRIIDHGGASWPPAVPRLT